jgi:DNA modification methylase
VRRDAIRPSHVLKNGTSGVEASVYVGDCREILPRIPECAAGKVDLVFADPPFNWNRAYDEWHDQMPDREYLDFTYKWIGLCFDALRPGGAMWINIPDDWAAEIVCHLKRPDDARRRMLLVNWCIWHYRFGQNTTTRFINSKVHALYFVKPGISYTWNPDAVLEESDRRAIYFDARTENKNDGMPAGMRVPMDVWYGKFWGRVQGNSKERRGYHDNQLPEVYLARVIRGTSREGDLVLDPFLGSGTTGVVAHALARRFIGVEYSEKNAASAVERMRAGPVRDVHAVGQSTAIFGSRRKSTRKKAKESGANGDE